MKNDLKKRILCVFLTLALVLGNVPVTVLAEEEDVPAAEETLLAETASATEPETVPETTAETVPETEPETVPETAAETEPETTEAAIPETIEAPEAETVDDEIPDAFVAAAAGASASGTCGENLTWKFMDGTLTISGTGLMEDFTGSTRPWDDYRTEVVRIEIMSGVQSIGFRAFAGFENMTDVTIPETVERIGAKAFWNCGSMTHITIPAGVTEIEDETFWVCAKLTDVSLPKGLERIGDYAFAQSGLRSITLPASLRYIGKSAFFYCTNLGSITIPEGVASIEKSAFGSCYDLTRIALPNSLSRIEDEAFSKCFGLTRITIPANVTWLGDKAFGSDSNITEIRFLGDAPSFKQNAFYDITAKAYYPADNNTWTEDVRGDYGGSLTWLPSGSAAVDPFNGTCGENLNWSFDQDTNTLTISGSGTMDHYDDKQNPSPWSELRSEITHVSITDGVESLGDYAFYLCSSLADITIPDTVKSLGVGCFRVCHSLAAIELPKSISVIPDDCFLGCNALTSIVIPEGVTTLGDHCFDGCYVMTSVSLPQSITSLGANCFYSCSALTSVVIPSGVLFLGEKCFSGCFELIDVEIPEGLTSLSEGCFSYCRSLTNVTLPDGLTSIGNSAFLSCWSLTAIKFPGSVTRIEESSFAGCSSLTEIIFPHSADDQLYIGKDAFRQGDVTTVLVPRPDQIHTAISGYDWLGSGRTVTFDSLYKARNIILKLGDVELDSKLPVDMALNNTRILSAVVQPDEAAQSVAWSSQETDVATVDKDTGEVTLKKIGTTVITAEATDGSGVSNSVELDVYYVTKDTKLTAAVSDVPTIGLQPGQGTTMLVSGSDPIAPDRLSFSSSNEGIASVDEKGVITAGTTPGTATITATPRGNDPLKRKVSVKVKVIAMQAEELRINVNGEAQPELQLSRETESRIYPLTALGRNYREEWFETNNVTWASTDTSVAKVTAASDGTVTLTIPAGASGACVVTATANDLNKVSAQLTVSVRDFSPRLASSSITLNSYSQQGVALDLRESYDNAIVSAELTGAPEGFRLDDMTLYAQAVKNGTYYPQLLVACEDGNTYSYKLQVKVASTLPAVTVKQTEKLNLFYTDSTASLSITAPGQTITGVVLTGTPDFQVEEEADGVYVLSRTDTQPKKLTTRATLEVELDGWSAPVTKAITISTATTAPKLSLTPASAVVRQADGIDPEVTLQVVDAEGNSIDPLYIACTPDFADVEKNAQSLVLTLTKQNSKGVYTGGTASLQVQLPTWTKPVVLKCKVTVSTKSPTMKLGTASLTLRHYFPEEAAQTVVTLDQSNLALEDVMIISTSKASAEAAKLDVTYENGVITARIKDATQLPKAGTYTYSCTGKTDAGDTKSVTLKVAVSAAQPKVTLSAKGKLDTLNPDNAIVYTPKLTNCIGEIDGVSLDGQDGDKFYVGLEDGKIILTLCDGEEYATNVTYKVQFRVSVCGEEIRSTVTSIKVTQSKVKLTAAPAALTLYQSQSASLWATLTQSAGEIGDVAISGKTSPELLAALGENGLNAVPEGNTAALELTVENAALLKAGKSYTLYLDVTPRNNAQNLKPNQIKLTVKVAK